jgi:EAL domain-containing protein (putative c-di-GMP-specific phosphodiesterase class I)
MPGVAVSNGAPSAQFERQNELLREREDELESQNVRFNTAINNMAQGLCLFDPLQRMLLRWRHPERGLVPPNTFIPLAEEIGFIVPIGEWVLRQACAAAAKWPDDLTVAVNLSPLQFRSPGILQLVVSALAGSELRPDRLELEITETALLREGEATLNTLYRLRELGVRIAMDDFGTGYSSLSYLQSFPFDKIKIDRSFIKDIAESAGSLNIVRAVAALAQGLGITATAEGVETEEQLEQVRAEVRTRARDRRSRQWGRLHREGSGAQSQPRNSVAHQRLGKGLSRRAGCGDRESGACNAPEPA